MKEKTKLRILLVAVLLSVLSCGSREEIISDKESIVPKEKIPEYPIYSVPVPGNSFITVKPEKTGEVITNTQLGNWTNPKTIISTYFRVSKSGKLNIGLKASVPNQKTSVIKVMVDGSQKKISLSGSKFKEYNAGEFQISTPGYVKVDIQGVERTGNFFADVTDITFSGEAATGENIFANKKNLYNRSRAGASPAVIYTLPKEEAHYFYSEITVPEGEDNPGIVFSAGFRRGLLSFENHGGKKLTFELGSSPTKNKISLNRKGDNVTIGNDNGKEEVNHKAVLQYDWKVGKTYKFLVEDKPDDYGNTDYTGWFLAPGEASWKLMASWKKQNFNDTSIKIFYNQLLPTYSENGYISKKAEYKNPWVKTKSGKWIPLTEAAFATYEIYENKQRTDAICKIVENSIFLQSGSFFNDVVTPGTKFSIPTTSIPDIDFSKLP